MKTDNPPLKTPPDVPHGDASAPITVIELTPPGRGAIASLRVEGPFAEATISRFFRRNSNAQPEIPPVRRIAYGTWVRPTASESVVLCQIAQNVFEIHCHGGTAAVAAIKGDLAVVGGVVTDWKSWVERSAVTRIEAEALVALSQATSEMCADILLSQLNGALGSRILQIDQLLQAGSVPDAFSAARQLLDSSPLGLHLVTPWRVVFVGPANVGKSSLINQILGYQRSIVHEQPGTTRDYVMAETSINGWPVVLTDTAGIRQADSPIESAGIDRTWQQAQLADIVVLVVDPDQCETIEYRDLRKSWPTAIGVLNKFDLLSDIDRRADRFLSFDVLTSARTGHGLGQLVEQLGHRIAPVGLAIDGPVLFTDRQRDLMAASLRYLDLGDIQAARSQLAELIGARPDC